MIVGHERYIYIEKLYHIGNYKEHPNRYSQVRAQTKPSTVWSQPIFNKRYCVCDYLCACGSVHFCLGEGYVPHPKYIMFNICLVVV